MILSGGVLTLAGQTFSLDSPAGLKLHKVVAESATFKGRKALRVTEPAGAPGQSEDRLAILSGTEFQDGVIEVDLAGQPGTGAGEGARGFVGIAFRLRSDMKTYDAFYLRPTNGRAEDQERRNHAAQYISQPDGPWFRLRKETPSRYESYVDLVPDVWTKVKIDVRGERARLYVRGQEQPTLVVDDLKSGAQGKGGLALWLERGTLAHFRKLTVEPAPTQ